MLAVPSEKLSGRLAEDAGDADVGLVRLEAMPSTSSQRTDTLDGIKREGAYI